ncbi:MAG: hypothetical protein Q8S33_18945 [Myxococcales bacterium]|nr:hypothetical protein [Myxococcales bacterium]
MLTIRQAGIARTLARALLTLSIAGLSSAAAPPPCAKRVQALKDLRTTLGKELHEGPIDVDFEGDASFVQRLDREGAWKQRGVRLVASKSTRFPADSRPVSTALQAVAREGKAQLCVFDSMGPLQRRFSLEADPTVVASLLKVLADPEVQAAPLADRSAVLAGTTSEQPFTCAELGPSMQAVAMGTPSDRALTLAGSLVESLEPCKCPTADVERGWAVVTLLADLQNSALRCTPLIAEKLQGLTGTVESFVTSATATSKPKVKR